MDINAVTVRPIGQHELEAVASLRVTGFGGQPERVLAALKSNPRYDFSHIIAAEYGGQLIGTTTIIPAKMWLSGVPLSVGAVAGVTVLPDYQRHGIAAKMMTAALNRIHDDGHAVSLLFPFRHQYYHQFGYGTVSDLHAYRIKRENLTTTTENFTVRPFSPEDLPMMRAMYKGQLTWRNGWFTRSNEWWAKLIERWPRIMVYDNDGMIEGYYAYELVPGTNGETMLRIIEFFTAEPAAFRALINQLAAQTEAAVIEYMAPADTPLRHSLRQPLAADGQNRYWIFNDLCHITAGPMGRIINLSKALTSRFYTRGMSGERVLKVTDPHLPANEEPIVFRLVDGRAETRPAGSATPQIETDIATLSQILCGYLKAMDALRLGRFAADEDTCSWLDKIIVDTPLFIQAGDWF